MSATSTRIFSCADPPQPPLSFPFRSKCFICGIEKTKFDEAFQKRGIHKGFKNEHIDHEHNMWDYMCFVMHLKHKDKTKYNGAESFVPDSRPCPNIRVRTTGGSRLINLPEG